MPIQIRPVAAALVALTPVVALAWTPEPPPGYGPPNVGYPGFPPAYGYPEMGPPAAPWGARRGTAPAGHEAGPQGTPAPGLTTPPSGSETAVQAPPSGAEAGGSPPSPRGPNGEPVPFGAPYGYPYGPPPFSRWGDRPGAMPGQLRVTREVTDDAYVVHILVSDGKTEEVQVTPLGRSLAISRSADSETVQEDSFDEGRGYQRSFSFSRGAVSRRIPLPMDADLANMTREAKDGTITLRIPRSARQGWGPGYRPGEGPLPGVAPRGSGLTTGPTTGPAPTPAGQP